METVLGAQSQIAWAVFPGIVLEGAARQIEPPWAGKLFGFTLLFEAQMLMLCQQMSFAAADGLVGKSRHRVAAIYERYVELALAQADFSEMRQLAVTEGRSVQTIEALAGGLQNRCCAVEQAGLVNIDMLSALIKGCKALLPNARVTFDKFHVLWHAGSTGDKMRRTEQPSDRSLKGMR